ncbi:MAG: M23 family metallopeptidase [Alphaproteobacteria bacterium]|nr:M23 family metallopeptidase [Alphaproteobacteria bacterium]
MKKFSLILSVFVLPLMIGCDLQPKILTLPDSVGDFISARYPALLADPNVNPEIYASAATDYGIYASPNLYGTDASSSDDYVMYASVDDYIIPPQAQDDAKSEQAVVVAEYESPIESKTESGTDDYLRVPMYGGASNVGASKPNEIVVARGDTMYSLARKYNTTVDELASVNKLSAPYTLSVGQKLNLPGVARSAVTSDVIAVPAKKAAGVQTTTRVALADITVGPGDTLYSISRKYSVPVNDLAVMNKLKAPFTLSVGQRLKVPNLKTANVKVAEGAKPVASQKNTNDKVATVAPVKKEAKKISSDPSKKLPAIAARSSSKFAWPVRGKILSNYGAKSNGLFNDGINIGATRGTAVKAAENGVVAYAGNEVKGMGNLIIIQHASGWMTVYAHMDSLAVRRGTRVSVGQKIGTVGASGKVDTPQLHFEIRKGTKAYNPSAYLK